MWTILQHRVRVGREQTVGSEHEDCEDALRRFLNAVADPTIDKATLIYEKDKD